MAINTDATILKCIIFFSSKCFLMHCVKLSRCVSIKGNEKKCKNYYNA